MDWRFGPELTKDRFKGVPGIEFRARDIEWIGFGTVCSGGHGILSQIPF